MDQAGHLERAAPVKDEGRSDLLPIGGPSQLGQCDDCAFTERHQELKKKNELNRRTGRAT
jgi:hypothetical protein